VKPKQKNTTANIIIACIALIVVLYFSYCMGCAVVDRAAAEAAGGLTQAQLDAQGFERINVLMTYFQARLSANFISTFTMNKTVLQALGIGAFVWFLVVAYYATNQKNYIHGKEYGTAHWASPKELLKIQSKALQNAAIAKVKKERSKRGMRKGQKEAKEQAKILAADYITAELQGLNHQKLSAKHEVAENPDDSWTDNYEKPFADEEARLKSSEYKAAMTESFYLTLWKPAKIEHDYQEAVKTIEEEYTKRITISTEEQRQKLLTRAEGQKTEALAEWSNVKAQKKAIEEKYKGSDNLISMSESFCFQNYSVNNNILILGGSGSGKTRGFVMPNVLQAYGSYVITDPKGEILEKAGFFLEKMNGYKIRVLNLDAKSESDGYNPFAYIHPERSGYEERIASLIETIIANTDGGEKKGGSDPFWDRGEKLFLSAIFYFVCDGLPPEEQSIKAVNDLIRMLQIADDSDPFDSDLDVFAELFAKRNKYGEKNLGYMQYIEFRKKAAGKTAKSIAITAVARLTPFDTREIQNLMLHDAMHLDRVGEEKTAVFVVVPPTDQTYNFIAGMLFTQLFQELQYDATQIHKHEGQRLPVPVRFILDEFANTCKIPHFVQIIAYARSFGIGVIPVLQSLEQIKNMYKDEWGVIVDNCATLLWLGNIKHEDTTKYMSGLLGKGTFDKRTTGRSKGRSGSYSQNFDVVGRELMTPDEIQTMPPTDCLVHITGHSPFYSKKYVYPKHKNYKYTSDHNKKYSYQHTPVRPVTAPPSHRESDPLLMVERERQRKAEIEAKMNSEVSSIELITAPQQILNYVSKALPHLQIMSDKTLYVNDGEAPPSTRDIEDALSFAETDSKTEAMRSQLLAGLNEEMADFAPKNKIEITTGDTPQGAMEIATHIVEAVKSGTLQPVDTIPSEGEREENKEKELIEGFESVEDEQTIEAQPDFGALSGELQNLMESFNSIQDVPQEIEE
jgi:type IV secretion system protein VirD4